MEEQTQPPVQVQDAKRAMRENVPEEDTYGERIMDNMETCLTVHRFVRPFVFQDEQKPINDWEGFLDTQQIEKKDLATPLLLFNVIEEVTYEDEDTLKSMTEPAKERLVHLSNRSVSGVYIGLTWVEEDNTVHTVYDHKDEQYWYHLMRNMYKLLFAGCSSAFSATYAKHEHSVGWYSPFPIQPIPNNVASTITTDLRPTFCRILSPYLNHHRPRFCSYIGEGLLDVIDYSEKPLDEKDLYDDDKDDGEQKQGGLKKIASVFSPEMDLSIESRKAIASLFSEEQVKAALDIPTANYELAKQVLSQ